MKIAILAWGSLVWNPRDLPLDSEWQSYGPELPIEFCRVSKDARLTLVVDPQTGVDIPVRFARSRRTSLLDAVADLRDREGTVMRHIGYTDRSGASASVHQHSIHQLAHDRVLAWLDNTDYASAVWTALPSNYLEQNGQAFSVFHATSYLQRLPFTQRENAFNYIRRSPAEVNTPLRRHLSTQGLL